MAVRDHLKPGLTDRARVRIMTVDPTTRRIEAMMKDASMIQVAVWDVPNAFRWPIETEIWIVRRDNGVWMLDRRVQQGEVIGSGPTIQTQPEPAPLEGMSPGEMKLDSATVIDANGNVVMHSGTPAGGVLTGTYPNPQLVGGQGTVSGDLIPSAASSRPGCLLCDGSAVSRVTYAPLFTAIGTAFGAGDGSTTFNVPNLRQRFPLGKAASGTGSTLGAAGGAIDHTHSVPSLSVLSHTHGLSNNAGALVAFDDSGPAGTIHFTGNNDGFPAFVGPSAEFLREAPVSTVSAIDHNTNTVPLLGSTDGGASSTSTAATGAQNPPYVVVNWFIKY